MTFQPTMTQAQVLYDSIIRSGSLAYSAAQVPGFELPNLYDWRDFSMFRSAAGATLIVDMLASDTWADTLAVWPIVQAGADTGITLEVSDDGTTWATVIVCASFTDPSPHWFDLAELTARYFRFTFDGAGNFRQIALGKRLQFPIGQWMGLNPPKLVQGVIVQNVISMNGSIIGRNLRRIEKGGRIDLTLLLPDWVRTEWDAFALHCTKLSFFYRWDPVKHGDEIAFAVADGIEAPVNDSPPPRMKVGMPIKFLT